jgi:sulfur-oxidizing protein SoxY
MRMKLNRRDTLLGLAVLFLPLPADATPADVLESISRTFGDRPIVDGPINLEAPPLAESGNSVPLTAWVESPMTANDRVVRLVLFAEQNPRPKTCEVVFGPAAAEARLTTNIRLASTQSVVCIAEMADGRLIRARHAIRVIVGACTTLPGRY